MGKMFKQCFLFCFLSALVDFFFFRQAYTDQLILYFQYHSWAVGSLRLAVHALILLGVSTAFLIFLRNIPKIGVILQWGIWLSLHSSYHIFYEVMQRFPDAQDVRNLLVTPWEMASGTILAVVSPMDLLKGLLPTAFVLAVWGCWNVLEKRMEQKTFPLTRRLMSAAAAFLVILFYLLYPTSRHVFFDSLSNSMHIFMQCYYEFQYYKIPRREYVPSTFRDDPEDNVVLVIDESIRGDYLSINNSSVDTTPVLEGYFRSLPKNMWNYGIALSAGNQFFSGPRSNIHGIDGITG